MSVVYDTTPVHAPLEILDNYTFYTGDTLAGDFNGDGLVDVLVSVLRNNYLSLIPGNGDGTFLASQTDFRLSVMTDEVDAVTTGDLDNDGNLDLIVAGKGTLEVFPGTTGGPFATPTRITFDTTNRAVAITAGDLNDDGKLDLAMVRDGDDSGVYVFYGNGTTMPSTPTVLTVDANLESSSLAIGDVDGDKLVDLVVASAGHNGVIVFLQTSTHSLAMQAPVTLLSLAQVVRLADFNGDGALDLALAGKGGLVTARNDGKGNFTLGQKLVAAAEVDDVIAVDLTNDGKPELVGASLLSLQLTAYPNLGASFGSVQSYTAGAMVSTVRLAAGDFDRDGRIDIVSVSQNDGIARVRNISK